MPETSGEIRRNHYRTKENFQISRILSRWKIIFSTFNRCAISETEQILYNQYQSAISLKFKFFQAYVWPHMFMMSSIYCLMSHSNQNRLDSFYRRCLRLIYCLFQCPTNDLHNHFKLPTLKDRFRMSLQKRIKNIQQHEPDLLDFYLQFKQLKNVLFTHYQEKPCIKYLPAGRPSNRLTTLFTSAQPTYIDKLISFVFNDDN